MYVHCRQEQVDVNFGERKKNPQGTSSLWIFLSLSKVYIKYWGVAFSCVSTLLFGEGGGDGIEGGVLYGALKIGHLGNSKQALKVK